MGMKEIQPFTIFQMQRIVQLEEGLMNIKNMEMAMEEANCDVLFIGDPDHEVQIDKAMIKTWKYGINAINRELKDEGLGDVAEQVIFLTRNKQTTNFL